MKLNYFLVFLFTLNVLGVYAQIPHKRCSFDEYRTSVLTANPGLQNTLDLTESSYLTSKTSSSGLDPNRVVTIPVVVHILHKGELVGIDRNVEDERVHEQIRMLNEFYSNNNTLGVDAKIRFCLAERDVFGNSTTGIYRYKTLFNSYIPFDSQGNLTAHDYEIKKNTTGAFPFQQYLNIWVADIEEWNSNGILYGYANFPAPDDNQLNIRDGVVINYRSFGLTNDSYAGLGATAVHEVGHWLGLFHTFESQCGENNCSTEGDKVCDTEPVIGPASDQPNLNTENCTGKDCQNNDTTSVQNIMDYNTDSCYNFFTSGQVERMRDMIHLYRSAMVNTVAPPVACVEPDSSGGGGSPGEFCSPNNKQDDLGYRIRKSGGSYGSSIDNDGNTLVVSDGQRGFIDVYTIREDCSVFQTGFFGKYDQDLENHLTYSHWYVHTFGDIVRIQGDRILITGKVRVEGSSSIYPFMAVYEKDNFGIYSLLQFEYIGQYLRSVYLSNDEIVLVTDYRFMSFDFNNSTNKYELSQDFSLVPNGYYHIYPRAAFQGNYLAILRISSGFDSSTSRLQVLKKTNGVWGQTPIYDQHLGFAGDISISENGDLYITKTTNDVAQIAHYEIAGSSVSYNTTTTLSALANNNNYDFIRASLPYRVKTLGDIVLIGRYGAGSTIHQQSGTNLNRILNISSLQDSSIEDVINPYDKPLDIAQINNLYGDEISISDKYYIVSNPGCGEIYIYNLANLLQGVSEYETMLMKTICAQVPPESMTSGTEITLGGSSCNVLIDSGTGKKQFEASTSITIKAGVHIKNGSDFSAKVNDIFCTLNGGLYSKPAIGNEPDPYTSKLYIYDEGTTLETRTPHTSISLNGIVISPNPTVAILEVSTPKDNVVISSAIFSLNNTRLLEFDNVHRAPSFEMDLSTFPVGIFIINLTMEDGSVISKKVIKH
tara:strand:- start:466 stop:3276 length:2811 start_codon:yes stop_codon:yes gene_type:complete